MRPARLGKFDYVLAQGNDIRLLPDFNAADRVIVAKQSRAINRKRLDG